MAEGGINRVNEAYFLINSKMIFFLGKPKGIINKVI